ncbi:MAG: glutaminyl-peptide cyclotransferase [Candidatus Bathyarchaeota archaeon]|nr:glutaminyl-peptide cyclotransferase [Candidatus Bathyarchaeota archaeon]
MSGVRLNKERFRQAGLLLLATLLFLSITPLKVHTQITTDETSDLSIRYQSSALQFSSSENVCSPRDFDNDNYITLFDVVYFAVRYQTTPSSPNWDPACDVALPLYIVDIFDIVTIVDHYGEEWSNVHIPRYYTYEAINIYPHDESAFTQGLVFENGTLYESTGLYGYSTLRRVELETGDILQIYSLPDEFFGEGLTIFDERLIQLTWKSETGFAYDKISFDLLQEFSYSTEGWGITHNGSHLIMSDGTAILHFLDSETFEEVRQIEVTCNGAVTRLNELEYIDGKVYANIWMEETIAIINPQTGQVEGWIDLSNLRDPENQDPNNVLNGIAYDENDDRLFVTGKRWSQLFEIKLVPIE